MKPTLLLLVFVGVGGWTLPIQGQGAGPLRPDGLYAHVHTNRGLITARLEHRRAPLATASFVGLAEGTIQNDAFALGRPYYDGSPFHRVVPGHVIQAGAPDSESADGPGYVYPNQIHAALSHDRAGVLGVANSGPHTNSGQFYVTLGDRSYLDGDYIVFGEVVEGVDVVFSVVQGDVVDSVRIVRVGEDAGAFRPDTESFQVRVRRAEERAAEQEEARRRAQEGWIQGNLPELRGSPDEVRTGPLTAEARAGGAWDREGAPGALRVRYRGTALRYLGHLLEHDGPPLEEIRFGSGEGGVPGFFDPPRSFTWDPEAGALPPGLEQVLAGMAPGDGLIAVVPSHLGYGAGGFYAPSRPGEPRFVISPHTMLVYEVEVLRAP